MVQKYILDAITQHALPADFASAVSDYYAPIAQNIASRYQAKGTPLLVGIQGTQGSGKSTMADFTQLLLRHEHGLNVAVVSIDDFYLTAASRKQLAIDVHPLLATRGVPGTHDLPLAFNTLHALSRLDAGETLALPRFNKAIDDRAPRVNWPYITGPVDVIIFEGWCIGIGPQTDSDISHPMNTLELEEDPTGAWRQYVNSQLAGNYAKLFNMLDCLVVITAPSFDVVFEWRALQEQKLAAKLKDAPPEQQAKIQTEAQLRRFIAHYQRLTCHGLQQLPSRADWVLNLDEQHRITGVEHKA